MGRFEISNRQYACFDAGHDSGLETGELYQFGDYERGHPLRRPEQAVHDMGFRVVCEEGRPGV